MKYRYQYTYFWSNVTTNGSLTSKILPFHIVFNCLFYIQWFYIWWKSINFNIVFSNCNNSAFYSTFIACKNHNTIHKYFELIIMNECNDPFYCTCTFMPYMYLNKSKTNYSAFNKVLLVIFSRKIMIWFGSIPSGQVTL